MRALLAGVCHGARLRSRGEPALLTPARFHPEVATMTACSVMTIGLVVSLLAVASVAHGQLAISANDNKVRLDNGTAKAVANAPADTITLIDLGARPPKAVAEI